MLCEHGPDVRSFQGHGYDGTRINAEEMSGCNIAQCLVPKSYRNYDDLYVPRWEPESDDQNFERQGKFFLSGLSDNMRSRDSGWTQEFRLPRHKRPYIAADNCVFNVSRTPAKNWLLIL